MCCELKCFTTIDAIFAVSCIKLGTWWSIYGADVSRAYASTVFRWNTATSTFDTVSTIMTQDARDLNTFMLGGWHFLTVSSPITGVTSYRFNAANSNFSEAQVRKMNA